MKTKKLSLQEYPTPLPYNSKSDILRLVNWEEKIFYKTEITPLPKFEKVKVKRNITGWAIFFMGVLKELRP